MTANSLSASGFSGQYLVRFFRRNLRRMILCFSLIFAALASLSLLMAPKYEAAALVEIAPTSPLPSDRQQNDSVTLVPILIKSQIDIIRTRVVTRTAERITRSEGDGFWEADSEQDRIASSLEPAMKAAVGLAASAGLQLSDWIGPDWVRLHLGGAASPSDDPRAALAREEEIRRNLNVSNDGRSFNIRIAYTSPDPVKAATIANTMAQEFVADQLEKQHQTSQTGLDWVKGRITELRRAVEESEAAANQFRRQNDLFRTQVSGIPISVITQQLTEYNNHLIAAQVERMTAEARLEQGGAGPEGTQATTESTGSLLIQNLRQREGETRQRIADLLTTLGPRHPRLISLENELNDLRSKIREEESRVLEVLKGEVNSARFREQVIQQRITDLEGKAAVAAQAESQLQDLERQVSANRKAYDDNLDRLKQIEGERGFGMSQAGIAMLADVPVAPLPPGKKLVLAIMAVFSGFLSVLFAIAAERFSRQIWLVGDIERLTGIGVLGLLPKVKCRGRAVEDYVLDRPGTYFVEVLQTIRSKIMLNKSGVAPLIVTVTSALPDEGKTVFSLSFARHLVKTGRKILLVDADLRRSRVAQVLGSRHQIGFAELMSQMATLTDAVQTDPRSSLRFIASPGRQVDMHQVIDMPVLLRMHWLFRDYDVVIIDSPPILPVSDAGLFGKVSDMTIFVTHWGSTPSDGIVNAIRKLRSFTDNIGGIVVNQVDMGKYARYDDGQEGYVHRKYRKYYLKAG